MSARKDSRPYGGAVPADIEWPVAQTKRHEERAVQAVFAREDIPTYLPLLRQWPRPAVGGEVGPRFRGHVFCQPDPIRLGGVASCNGALRLVSFGDVPARAGSEVIAYLRRRGGSDGVIDVNPIVAGHLQGHAGRHAAVPPRFAFALPCDVPLQPFIADSYSVGQRLRGRNLA